MILWIFVITLTILAIITGTAFFLMYSSKRCDEVKSSVSINKNKPRNLITYSRPIRRWTFFKPQIVPVIYKQKPREVIIPQPPTIPVSIAVPPVHFTVCSYNVRIDVDPKPHDWSSRAPQIVRNLKTLEASVICLQESSEKVKQYLVQKFPSFLAVGAARSRRSEEAVHVLFDQSLWALERDATYVFNQGGLVLCNANVCSVHTTFQGIQDKHPRIFTHVVLRNKTGKLLHVLNVHLSLNLEIQRASLKQLGKFVATQIPSDEAVLVAGDLNAHYLPTDLETPLQELIKIGGLHDAHHLTNTPTFGTFYKLSPDVNRLDYILFRGGLHLNDSGISSYTYKDQNGHTFRPSDHEAIFGSFRFL
jgi:endonuclease/exonuclease/phosphatase family metal-dependent hydrolase